MRASWKLYLTALLVAGVIISAGLAYNMLTRHSVLRHIREQIRDQENGGEEVAELERQLEAGKIPPGWGFEVPAGLILRINIADLLAKFWYVWVTMTFGGCFTIAHLLVRRKAE